MAERSKARVCGRSLAKVAGSNPAGAWMFVLCMLYSQANKAKPGQSGQRSRIQIKYKKKIPVGTRFSAPVQTGPEAHPVSYTMGTGSLSGA